MNSNSTITDYSIVLAAHGSRDSDGIAELESLVDLMRNRADGRLINHGYLEFASPTINEAVKQNIKSGSRKIVVVPALLTAATHAKNDMPVELSVLKTEFPEVDLHFGAAMDLHPQLLQLSQERIISAEAQSSKTISRKDTCLVVVGRGTSDSDANSDISKLTRMLEEGMGFGTSFVCYSGTAKPLVADGLKAAAKLGHKRIIIFPYFLFDGILIKRIYAASDMLTARHTEIDVLKANYLGIHPNVADVFLERAQEGIEGRSHMNCSLCKYRVQIVGFESQIGLPQKAGHGKVRGLSNNNTLSINSDAPVTSSTATIIKHNRYIPHPIEAESMQIIATGRDWSGLPPENLLILQRLVHTSGDFSIPDDIFISPGAVDIGIKSLLRCRKVITDVTMVETGLKRSLIEQLGITTWCGVHDRETHLMADSNSLTRSAAGIRRAWQIFGNDLILAIGDAPTAILETISLIKNQGWRPQLVIGLPVGFVGTHESKQALKACLHVPRITNTGTKGGSPWAASVVNALMIGAVNYLAKL